MRQNIELKKSSGYIVKLGEQNKEATNYVSRVLTQYKEWTQLISMVNSAGVISLIYQIVGLQRRDKESA